MLLKSSLGLLNMALLNKYKYASIPFSIKIIDVLDKLKFLGYINTYVVEYNKIKILFSYHKSKFVLNKFIFNSAPNAPKSLTYKQIKRLKLKQNRVFLLHTKLGICTSDEALNNKIGGIIIVEIN